MRTVFQQRERDSRLETTSVQSLVLLGFNELYPREPDTLWQEGREQRCMTPTKQRPTSRKFGIELDFARMSVYCSWSLLQAGQAAPIS